MQTRPMMLGQILLCAAIHAKPPLVDLATSTPLVVGKPASNVEQVCKAVPTTCVRALDAATGPHRLCTL